MEKDYFDLQKDALCDTDKKIVQSAVKLVDVWPVFAAFGAGLFVSYIVFAMETILHEWQTILVDVKRTILFSQQYSLWRHFNDITNDDWGIRLNESHIPLF